MRGSAGVYRYTRSCPYSCCCCYILYIKFNIRYKGISTWLLYTGLSTWTNTIHYGSTYLHTCIFTFLFAAASLTHCPRTLPQGLSPMKLPNPYSSGSDSVSMSGSVSELGLMLCPASFGGAPAAVSCLCGGGRSVSTSPNGLAWVLTFLGML